MKTFTQILTILTLIIPSVSLAMEHGSSEEDTPPIVRKKTSNKKALSVEKEKDSSSSEEDYSSSEKSTKLPVSSISITKAHNHDCECHDCEETRKNFVSTKPGSGKWKDKVTPKEGWICTKVEDLGSPALTCQMCERENIRYTHTMHHNQHTDLIVGCICAGHMEEDLQAAKERESYLTSRAQRRQKWLSLKWKTSKNGNPYIKTKKSGLEEGHHVVITSNNKFGRLQYSAMIDKSYTNLWFGSMDEAKYAAFDYLWPASKTF